MPGNHKSEDRPCPSCGSALSCGAIWCVGCSMYQKDADTQEPKRTVQCQVCGFYVPSSAKKCYQCDANIDGTSSGRKGLSATTLTSVIAILSTLVALVASSHDLIAKIWQSDADVRVKLQSAQPGLRRITVVAINTGDRIGLVNSFSMSATITDAGVGGKPHPLRETLLVGADLRSNLTIPGNSQQSVWLAPDGSESFWDLHATVKRQHPDYADSDVESEETAITAALRAGTSRCDVVFEADAKDRRSLQEFPIGTVNACREFLMQAYAVKEQ